ncbi:cytochrome c family protein [Candidatus Magnetominusculus xianensis]|uniref:Cytochrome c-552/4 domain-containing protein n=1 Tax=Candidatus Magnetominusculus xianensis TaxID=1748249 RepID=A0ABR5SCA6_9BACT|nr:cytochrome c family protein [Candidatus Magnetominusculus xianensis]KWT79380.1 hypothetical protein ASN18_2754 [Candidatus Magnetominusculus xianensis]MBF0405487.1 hypothetical protein [Nitrospirota bacterium]
MKHIIVLMMVFMATAAATFPAILSAHDVPDGAAPYEKSKRCSACHPAIYRDWENSMHSKSSLHKDPAHKAMYEVFLSDMKKEGKEGSYHCASCHMPMAENIKKLMDGTDKPNENLWREDEGVGCAFCHRVETIVEGKGRNMFTINKDGAYVSSNPPEKAPHGVGANPLLASGEICMGCHSHLTNQSGVAICSMKEEGKGNCLDCHMEKKEGPPSIESNKNDHASHEMGGGHSLPMLRKALSVKASVNEAAGGKTVDIEITNKTAHTFPSTMPMRMAYVKVVAYDAQKKTIFRNYEKNPMEDKNAVFMKSFKGGGEVGVPAWKAEGVAVDTRLKSDETRTFSYTIQSDKIKTLTVEVIYRLFPSQAIAKYPALKETEDSVNDKQFAAFRKEFTY